MRPVHDVSRQSRIEYLEEISRWLTFKAEGHRWWKIHSSTYGCWICLLLDTNTELLETLKLLSPHSLDVSEVANTDEPDFPTPTEGCL